MTFNLGQVAALHLPSYLCAESKAQLLSEIRAFPHHGPFYTSFAPKNFFQGDCINSVELFDQSAGKRITPSVLILSNTCDIDLSNPDRELRHVVVAPIVRVRKYVELLENNGKSRHQIDSTLSAIRSQEVFHIFHLPESEQHNFLEGFLLLDHLFSLQVSSKTFNGFERKFSLTGFGHYLLLVKLSVHFTRLWESFDRIEQAAG